MNTVCSQVWKDFKQTEGSSADPVLCQRSWYVLNKHRRWSVLVISDPALSGPDVILHMKTDSDSNIRSAPRIIVYLKPRYQPGSGNIWIGVCQIMIVAQMPIISNTCAGADFMVQVLQGYLGRSARWSLSRERTLCFTFTSGVLTPVTSAPLTKRQRSHQTEAGEVLRFLYCYESVWIMNLITGRSSLTVCEEQKEEKLSSFKPTGKHPRVPESRTRTNFPPESEARSPESVLLK